MPTGRLAFHDGIDYKYLLWNVCGFLGRTAGLRRTATCETVGDRVATLQPR